MATVRWIGAAPAITQLDTFTPSAVDVSDTFTITCNGKDVVFTATAGTVANVTAGLVALLSSTTSPPPPEFQEVTWTDNVTTLSCVAKTAGKPYTFTSSSVGGGLARAATRANSGPNDVSIGANWSTGTVPASDDIVIDSSAISMLYSLAQQAVTPTSVTVGPNYSGQIGLPAISGSGYAEYREQYLRYAPTTVTYAGKGNRARISTEGATCALTVNDTGSSADPGLPCLLLKGTVLTLRVNKGTVGVAAQPTETATLVAATVSYIVNQDRDASLLMGSGCATLPSLTMAGGDVTAYNTISASLLQGGTLNQITGAQTACVNERGTLVYRSITTMASYKSGQGTLDLSQDGRARTITVCELGKGSSLLDPLRSATFTNKVKLVHCAIGDIDLDLGSDISLVPTAN